MWDELKRLPKWHWGIAILLLLFLWLTATNGPPKEEYHYYRAGDALNAILASITSERVVALFTVVLAGVGIITYFTFNRQADLLDKQIKLGRDEFNATHRPEITIHAADEAAAVAQGGAICIAASFVYFNRGTVPARNVQIGALIVPMALESPIQQRIAIPLLSRQPREEITPGKPYTFAVWSNVEKNRLIGRFENGEPIGPAARAFCIGTISYDDGAGVRRETGFCWRYSGTKWIREEGTAYDYEY